MNAEMLSKKTIPDANRVGDWLAKLHAKVAAEERTKPRCLEEHTVRGVKFMCVWKAGHWTEEHMDRKGRIWIVKP